MDEYGIHDTYSTTPTPRFLHFFLAGVVAVIIVLCFWLFYEIFIGCCRESSQPVAPQPVNEVEMLPV
ncbi:hypothetical protein MtrunA17_Chr1g0151291 [Medicago truncatula]|uniref:Transmembrane protein, putative n=1 Tax=Medicago truncatula TaxID=3880 RepID=G7I9W7_MEDTR|nr:transmembrane protein, putative [Medicago truncatula]RHN77115.1 hypothetical protein MtrunA17_Chr1g0151291 [Medicago truncatula]